MAEELIAGITFLAGSCALYAHRQFKDYKARQRQRAKDLENHLREFEKKRGITGNDTATYAKVLTEIYGCESGTAKRQRVSSPTSLQRPTPRTSPRTSLQRPTPRSSPTSLQRPTPRSSPKTFLQRPTPRTSPVRTASSSSVRRFRAKRTPRQMAMKLYTANQPKWHISPKSNISPKWHISPLVAPSAANSPRTSPKGFF